MIQAVPFISMMIFGGLLFYFASPLSLSNEAGTSTLFYYLRLILRSLKELGVSLTITLLTSSLLYLILFYIKFSLKKIDLRSLRRKFWGYPLSSLRKETKYLGKCVIPTMMSLIFLSFLLGHVNQINSVHLKDDFLINLDISLTGVHPSFFLASFSFPDWFVQTVVFSFGGLATVLMIAAICIFMVNRPLLQEFCASFCLVLLFAFPLWLIFPALSPHDRFIDNVYRLPISPVLAREITDYKPNPYLKQFLAEMRSLKEESGSPYLPTSTMPSAHVAWAVLMVYYLFRTRILIGTAALLFSLLASFGTVFLAQHYFVDVIAGMLIAGVAVAVTNKINTIRLA